MKVKELIEKPSKFDKNTEILIPVGEDEYGFVPFENVAHRYWDRKIDGIASSEIYSSKKPNCVVSPA